MQPRELARPQLEKLVSSQVVVLAAHPDDETIGASVLLAHCPRVMVAYLTDGAPRDTRFWPAEVQGPRDNYADIRRNEAENALAHASVQEISWLGGVDQEAVSEIETLTARFSELVKINYPDVVVTHPYEGGHPDHDAAALIVRLALARIRIKTGAVPEVLEMTSYHADGDNRVTGEFLNADPGCELELDLSKEDRERKHRMIDAYSSQRLVLQNFPIRNERIRNAPKYNFALPPHPGKLWYECMGWPMTGSQWRSLAASAAAELQECMCR